MFYFRRIFPEIKKHLRQKQITVLTGMRRTGKTTIVKKLIQEIGTDNKLYIDLERLDNRELFQEKNYDNIIRRLSVLGLDPGQRMYLALDEIQLVPGLASALKYIYDNYDIKILATGSSSFYLKDLFSESLAGRKKIFELDPLDFGEYLIFRQESIKPPENFLRLEFDPYIYEQLKVYYEDYIRYGGFPEVVLAGEKAQKTDLLWDIINSYVNVDIRTLSDFRKNSDIFNLLKLLSARVGTRLDYSKLSRASGLSRPTVLGYLDFFEKTFLIKRVPVRASSPDREIVKAKKLYFADSGLAGTLSDPNSGAKFENAIYNQLRARGRVEYYARKSGREIDFVLDGRTGLEAKETPIAGDQKSLDALCRLAGLRSGRLVGRHPSPEYRNYIWGGDIR